MESPTSIRIRRVWLVVIIVFFIALQVRMD
uniref:Uncharacterized protein n=1 Tax=Rhizophora mucronata TaxID=61149 RepID=A0A2P2IL51_RHIMU